GLNRSQGPLWHSQRKLISMGRRCFLCSVSSADPMFASLSTKLAVPGMQHCVQLLCSQWEAALRSSASASVVVEASRDITAMVAAVVARTVFGEEALSRFSYVGSCIVRRAFAIRPQLQQSRAVASHALASRH